jgi:endogenous inhibitor of DNA gyrase (YacG/DUF329 family)
MSERRCETEKSNSRPCPICGNPLPADGRSAPFCSEQCRLVDLHGWLTGRYRVDRPLEERDLDE